MNKLIIVLCCIFLNCIIIYKIQDDCAWKPILFVSDTLSTIKVSYKEKCDSEKTVLCNAIFENRKTNEYKLVAPWINMTLQKNNLVLINFNKIKKGKKDE